MVGRLDRLTVLCELRTEGSGDPADVAREVRSRIKGLVGVMVEVEVGAPGTVPRSAGKAQRVVDRRLG